MLSYGDCLRIARKRKHLSQDALSELSGIDRKGISRIENGTVSDPHLSTMEALSDALGITIDELIHINIEDPQSFD